MAFRPAFRSASKSVDLDLKIVLQPKQHSLLSLALSVGDEVPTRLGFGGARGGGKSGSLRRIALALAFKNPNIPATIVRRTYGDLKDNHIDKFWLDFPGIQQFYNAGNEEIAIPMDNGMARVLFRYAENERDVERKFMGPEYGTILVDQSEQFTETELKIIGTAARWPDTPRGLCKCLHFFNPGGIGTGYFRRIYHTHEFTSDESASDFAFIQAFGWDNYCWFDFVALGIRDVDAFYAIPSRCSDDDETHRSCCRFHLFINHTQYGHELNTLPPSQKIGHLYGSFDKFAGQYFAGVWDEKKIVLSSLDTEKLIQPWWIKWLSIDWGFDHFAVALWFATGRMGPSEWRKLLGREIDHTVDVFVISREHIVNDTGESEFARAVVDLTPMHERRTIKDIFIDPSAGGKRGSSNTPEEMFNWVFRKHGLPTTADADNDRIPGWRFLWNCMKQTCLVLGGDDPLPGIPMMLVSEECPGVISSIPQLVRDSKHEGKNEDVLKTNSNTDPKDDIGDAVRYGAHSKLNPKKQAPSSERLKEELGKHYDPNSRHIAALQFKENERRNGGGRVIAPGRWRQ